MSNEIILKATLNRNVLYATGHPQLVYLLLEIQPRPTLTNSRLPLNFSLVLDKSGSMEGEKIDQLREAVKVVIDQMQANDVISVITFSMSSKGVVPAQAARDKLALKNAVDKIKAEGGTQLSPGMKDSLIELAKHSSPQRLSRLIVLTDGQTTNERACRKQADEAGASGIPIIALGLGDSWNEHLLQDLATRSGGRADYIPQPQDITAIFQDVWQSLQIVASNLSLTVRLTPNIEARAVWQVSPEIKNLTPGALGGGAVTLSLAELEASGQALIVELMVPAKQPGQYRLAQAEVAYDVPPLHLTGEKVRTDLIVAFTLDGAAAQPIEPRVMNWLERFTAYKLQQRGLADLARGDVPGATQKLRAAATRLLDMDEEPLGRTLLAEADRLQHQGQLSESGQKTIKLQSNKTRKLSD